MANNKALLRRRTALADAIAGLVASLVALGTFYPLDVIKTNLQAGKQVEFRLDEVYRGWRVKVLHTASSSFLYFYIYSFITTWWKQRLAGSGVATKPSTLARLGLSAVAAMMNTCLTLPLDVLSSQQQTSFGDEEGQEEEENEEEISYLPVEEDRYLPIEEDEQDEKKDDMEPMAQPKAQKAPQASLDNLSSLWKGLVPSLLLCTNPAIHFTVFDILKSNILLRQNYRDRTALSFSESFLIGLVAKLTATLITYPLIRAKILLMVACCHSSLLGTLVREYKRDGMRGLYRGCNLQLAHTILKSALLMMVREEITTTTHCLIVPS